MIALFVYLLHLNQLAAVSGHDATHLFISNDTNASNPHETLYDLSKRANDSMKKAFELRKIVTDLENIARVKEKSAEEAQALFTQSQLDYLNAMLDTRKLSLKFEEEKLKEDATHISKRAAEYLYNDAVKREETKKLLYERAQSASNVASEAAASANMTIVKPLENAIRAESDAFWALEAVSAAAKHVPTNNVKAVIDEGSVMDYALCMKICAESKMFPYLLVNNTFKLEDVSRFKSYLESVHLTTQEAEAVMAACNDSEIARCMKVTISYI